MWCRRPAATIWMRGPVMWRNQSAGCIAAAGLWTHRFACMWISVVARIDMRRPEGNEHIDLLACGILGNFKFFRFLRVYLILRNALVSRMFFAENLLKMIHPLAGQGNQLMKPFDSDRVGLWRTRPHTGANPHLPENTIWRKTTKHEIVIYYVCGSWLHLFLGKASTASFGLHLNPLVSFGLFSLNCSKNRGSCRNLGIYLIVQITAALSAAFFVSHILPIGLHLLGPTSSLVRHSFARQVILRIFG